MRRAVAGLVALFLVAGILSAADKQTQAKVVKVDVTAKTLTVSTDSGEKTYTISDDTMFLGPKGGVSDAKLKDDRLVPGAMITLVIAGNNKTVREVHLPERNTLPKK